MKIILSFLLAICFLCIGCSNISPKQSNFDLIFKYGYGPEPKNELNTFNGMFTKDMTLEPSITVNLVLSQQEMDKIYQDMKEIDFFDYPDVFAATVTPGSTVMGVTPYLRFYFKVNYNSQIKELYWEDEIQNDDLQASKLRWLSLSIKNLIESKEEYKKLPSPKSRYMQLHKHLLISHAKP